MVPEVKKHDLLLDIELHMVFAMINQYLDTSKGQFGAPFGIENKYSESKNSEKRDTFVQSWIMKIV